MTASVKQRQANRQNATRSSGPKKVAGKARVGGNALKHSILSQQLLLAHESAEDFQALVDALQDDLRPVGSLEHLLVDRIAVTVWRQRRLVAAETAVVQKEHQPRAFLDRLSGRLPTPLRYRFSAEFLDPPDQDEARFSQDLLTELEGHTDPQALLDDPKSLLHRFAMLCAEDEGWTVQEVVDDTGGLDEFVAVARDHARQQVDWSIWHTTAKTIADLLRAELSIPGSVDRERLDRYQITLDNQLYRALKELRAAQAWRLKSLEGEVQPAAETGTEDA